MTRVRLQAGAALTMALLVTALVAPAVAQPPPHSRAPGADVTNVAHRGASGVAPENTIAAVEAGVRARADMVEVDVQRSADGELVIIHDTTLDRTTDVEEVFPDRAPWNVGDFTLEEMRRLDAGSWFGEEFAGEPIPTLDEVLAALRGGVGLLLEVKSPELYPGLAADVAAALEEWPGYLRAHPRAQRLVVQSFDYDFMREYHELQPDVPVGLLGGPPGDEELVELATWADQINPSFTTVDAAFVEAVHDLGMTTSVYTVNAPSDMREMIALGVDGIITNYPAVLRDLLRGGPGVDPRAVAITDVVGDAPGDDVAYNGGEYVAITNVGHRAVDVSDWYLRDGAYNRLDIGDGYVLAPGATLQVHSGPGDDDDGHSFNGRSSSIINNGGDSIALHAPDGTVEDLFSTY